MNLSMATWLVMGGVYAFVTVASALQPYLAPRNILFGVSLPLGKENDADVLKLKKSYISGVLGISLLLAAIVVTLAALNGAFIEEGLSVWLSAVPVGALLLQLAVSGAWFIFSHSKALSLKEERGWEALETKKGTADLKIRTDKRLIYSPVWFLPHLLVIVICAGAAWLFYDRIPEQIIMHYNAQGVPDRIEPKSVAAVFQLNLIQLGMLVLFYFVNYTTQAARLKLHPGAPEEHREQQIRYRRGMSLLNMLLGLGIVIFMGVVQAFTLYAGEQEGGIVIAVAGMIPLLLSGAAVFGLMSLGKNRTEAPRPGEDGHWKAGAFYWNRNDASIFVEKRSGIGFTLNWAHPVSWLVIIILLGIILVPIILGI
ncbi:DUF5808 domain-containing protein [Paenibacillus pasadenensis]|uniref:DUF1648 domain-containing protein n=1 Tax=Paenibacillus pasadenensis TaxID=217090 RepID=UPI0020405961|nr:DUF5808 domain-containing protein [Paenibacillus pasadenensis]MCM3749460.1 DUF5808 domain-containing protein [Paenibacillus pasadenensis]